MAVSTVIGHRAQLGFEAPSVNVQVKSNERSIGDPVVSAPYGKVSAGEFGLLVTPGTFTPPAQAFARSKSNLRLVVGQEFVDLVLDDYEKVDSRYKGPIRLKRVYAPAPLEGRSVLFSTLPGTDRAVSEARPLHGA